MKAWEKITAIATTVVAVIGGIALLITHLTTINKFFQEYLFPPPKPPAKEVVVPPPPIGACDTLQVKAFRYFPSYLVNTYNNLPYEENKYIYWGRVSGRNHCEDRLQIEVWLKPDPLKATVDKEGFSDTVEVHQGIDKVFPISWNVMGKIDKNIKIHIDWKIFKLSNGDAKKLLRQGILEVFMIAGNHVYWDLRDPDNQPVDLGFLLASLSAWSIMPQKAPPEIGERSRKYLLQAGNDEDWLRNCYRDLFRTDAPVRVHRFTDPWPLRGHGLNSQQRIRTSEMVLAGKRADSLEAALLIAALKKAASEDVKIELVLFALPMNAEKDNGEKRFLLAWSPKRDEWRAFDLTAPNDLDFDQNVQQASIMLAKVLETRGDKILQALNDKGVFYDEKLPLAKQSLVALNFKIATGEYHIAGLPQE